MKHRTIVITAAAALLIAAVLFTLGTVNGIRQVGAAEPSKLMVLWTSGDRDVAIKMVYMYAYNAKKQGWWDEVRFVIWGPSSLLLSVDKDLQDYLKKMKDEGVILEACKACSDMYGVSDKLTAMGVDVKYMGKPLTEMLKSGYTTMTF
ncbi:DsrE family protein [Candidatus Latescibacterota bacterium]